MALRAPLKPPCRVTSEPRLAGLRAQGRPEVLAYEVTWRLPPVG